MAKKKKKKNICKRIKFTYRYIPLFSHEDSSLLDFLHFIFIVSYFYNHTKILQDDTKFNVLGAN